MRSGSSLLHATVILFIGCLAVCANCRPVAEQAELYLDGPANSSTNATAVNTTSSVDESKLYLKFCSPYLGCRFDDGSYHKTCWCCTMPGGYCYPTKQECWDTCPACDPNCPGSPNQPAIESHA